MMAVATPRRRSLSLRKSGQKNRQMVLTAANLALQRMCLKIDLRLSFSIPISVKALQHRYLKNRATFIVFDAVFCGNIIMNFF